MSSVSNKVNYVRVAGDDLRIGSGIIPKKSIRYFFVNNNTIFFNCRPRFHSDVDISISMKLSEKHTTILCDDLSSEKVKKAAISVTNISNNLRVLVSIDVDRSNRNMGPQKIQMRGCPDSISELALTNLINPLYRYEKLAEDIRAINSVGPIRNHSSICIVQAFLAALIETNQNPSEEQRQSIRTSLVIARNQLANIPHGFGRALVEVFNKFMHDEGALKYLNLEPSAEPDLTSFFEDGSNEEEEVEDLGPISWDEFPVSDKVAVATEHKA
ncbi:MAG: hypothetical protein V4487_04170 [Chlamydiota bacterium]